MALVVKGQEKQPSPPNQKNPQNLRFVQVHVSSRFRRAELVIMAKLEANSESCG